MRPRLDVYITGPTTRSTHTAASLTARGYADGGPVVHISVSGCVWSISTYPPTAIATPIGS